MTDEGETLDSGVAHGHKWRVDHVRGKHLAGYVQTNLRPPWNYDDLQGFEGGPLEVHGSLTYGVDEDGWIGFDCAHSGDVCIVDGETMTDYGGGSREREWTVDDVAAECRSLARQVAGLEEAAPETCGRCGQSEADVDVISFGPLDVCKVCESAHEEGRWSVQEVIDGGE